ncbi:MAG TPA: energy transducer TonB [Blastocatellia bacterium]|jgi:TonB family protein|nr:energy transducer TonB [Blastocatellia bacterium]
MKLCPKCGQSFAEGFTFCPRDAARLEKYDLRAAVRRDDEFHFLLERDSLITRLKRELASAFGELRANPRAFLRGLLRGEGNTRQRKRLLGAGFASGLLVYASFFVAVSLIGFIKLSMSEPEVKALEEPYPLNEVTLLFPTVRTEKDQAKSGKGFLGGSLKDPKRPNGGGGANDPKRASKGVPPAASDVQLAQPSPQLPEIARSSLVIRPTVIADPNSLLHFKGPVGMMDSPPEAPPSPGSGRGNGIGQGDGSGYASGKHAGVGGGTYDGPGGGRTTGTGTDTYVFSDSLKPTILYRERAKYTEQARLNRVQGTVLLAIVFGADGRIRDIRTVRGLPDGLTETSIEAAQKIRFHPAVLNGKPVNVRATLEFNFALY